MLCVARTSIRPGIVEKDGVPPAHQTSKPAILVPGAACTCQPAPESVGAFPGPVAAAARRCVAGSAVGSPHVDRTACTAPSCTSFQSPSGSSRPDPSAHAQTL